MVVEGDRVHRGLTRAVRQIYQEYFFQMLEMTRMSDATKTKKKWEFCRRCRLKVPLALKRSL
jgi:hypothetical protein